MQDEATGLYYLRARYYDPAVGRFISKDTYEGSITNQLSLNLYTYVENNPIIYTDPSGNWCTATVNGKLYSHPGKCSGSGSGQDYIPDSNATNLGRTIVDAGVSKGKWYPEGAFYIKEDKTGITDAVIGCARDSQCSGFVSGAISEVPAAYNGVKSAASKTIDTVKEIFGGGAMGTGKNLHVNFDLKNPDSFKNAKITDVEKYLDTTLTGFTKKPLKER